MFHSKVPCGVILPFAGAMNGQLDQHGKHGHFLAAHALQFCIVCKTKNGHQGATKWQMGSGKGSTLRLWGTQTTFAKQAQLGVPHSETQVGLQ